MYRVLNIVCATKYVTSITVREPQSCDMGSNDMPSTSRCQR